MFPLRNHRNTGACSSFLLRLSRLKPFDIFCPACKSKKNCANRQDIADGTEDIKRVEPIRTPQVYHTLHRSESFLVALGRVQTSPYSSSAPDLQRRPVRASVFSPKTEVTSVALPCNTSDVSFQPCEDYLEPPLPLFFLEVDPLTA